MQSIIEDLFYGRRGLADNVDFGKEYERLGAEGLEIYNKLYPTLTPEQKKQLDDIFWSDAGQESEAVRVNYIEGFKVGFLIAVECFTK